MGPVRGMLRLGRKAKILFIAIFKKVLEDAFIIRHSREMKCQLFGPLKIHQKILLLFPDSEPQKAIEIKLISSIFLNSLFPRWFGQVKFLDNYNFAKLHTLFC